jgi:nicotinate-nucleotide adenylyltransferase
MDALMQRVGVLGGTFDPIHYGHLALAEEARWALGLERVYLVPNAQQPLKRESHAATPAQRLEMVRLACQANPAFLPSDIEVRRPPPSYTVETLRELRALHSGPQGLGKAPRFWFLAGSDVLDLFPRWYRAEEILSLARLAVLSRPGMPPPDFAALDAALPGASSQIDYIIGPRLDISSSSLRQRFAAGQPARYQMPDAVLNYIQQHQIYGTPHSACQP